MQKTFEGHHLWWLQSLLRHSTAAVDVQGGQAESGRHGDPPVPPRTDQRGLHGHAGGRNIRGGIIRYTDADRWGITMSQKTNEDTPVMAASRESWRCVQTHDREGWLALMAPDVVIEDPIGEGDHQPGRSGSARQGRGRRLLRRQHRRQQSDGHLRGIVRIQFAQRGSAHSRAAKRIRRRLQQHRARSVHLPPQRRRSAGQSAGLLEHGRHAVRPSRQGRG